MADHIANQGGMHRAPSTRLAQDPLILDDTTVDRLLEGVAPEDSPPAYATVAALLRRARVPATDAELAGEPEALAAFRSAGRSPVRTPAAIPPQRRATTRLAGTLVTVSLLGLAAATSAAAATGTLPAPAQRAAHQVLSAVGVNVPDAPSAHPSHPSHAGQSSTGGNAITPHPPAGNGAATGRAGDASPTTQPASSPGSNPAGDAAVSAKAGKPVGSPDGGSPVPTNGIGERPNASGGAPRVVRPSGSVTHSQGQGNSQGQSTGQGNSQGQTKSQGISQSQTKSQGQGQGTGKGSSQGQGNVTGSGTNQASVQTPNAASSQGKGGGNSTATNTPPAKGQAS